MRKTDTQKMTWRQRCGFYCRQPWFLTMGIILLYFALAFAAYWPVYPGDSSRVVGCACGDAAQSAWFLRWTPYAILHGHNPLFTSWINVPFGANLTQNTLMPVLGLIMAPVTLLVGPMASFNTLAWLAFPLSAMSMFYVVRKLQFSRLAAFVAGLLFGFSPYMVGQGEGHVMLSFVPLLPLIMLSCWRLFIQQEKTRSPYILGVLLAVELILQFFIDPEIVALAFLIVALGVVLLVLSRRTDVSKERLAYALQGLSTAAIVSALVLAYPIWFMVSGPQHFRGPNFPPGNPYRSDLIGLVVPMLNQRFLMGYFHHYAMTTADAGYSEVGDYVGIVLLAIIGVALVKWRRNRWLIFSVVMAFLIWIGSLGPRLVINTHKTPIIMPFAVVTKLPLLQDMLPSRLSLGEWLFVAFAVAIIVNEWQRSKKGIPISLKGFRARMATAGIAIGVLFAVLSLLPRWPYPTKVVNEPSYFKGTVAAVANKTVLAYPLPIYTNDQFMLWQADSNMAFKLVGSYIQDPNAQGTQSQLPPLLSPVSVEEWLATEQGGSPWQPVNTVSPANLIAYLKNNKVGAVMIDQNTVNAGDVTRVFRSVLGRPMTTGGVVIWDNVQASVL